MVRAIATVSSKGQLVIPASIREELGITPGTKVALSVEGNRVIVEPDTVEAKIRRLHELRGITAGYPSGTDLLLEERRLERERELREEGW
jgi:AbrB family looped-hinge helix DNA binding protein